MSIHSTNYVNTSKNFVLFYVIHNGYTNSGMTRRLFVTNRGIFKAVSGASYLHGISDTVRDRSVTFEFNGSGLVSGMEDHGPVTVSFSE